MKKSLKVSGFEFLLGEKLGEGCFRKVYELRYSSERVIKIEEGLPKSNINEHQLWWDCESLRDWLCPVEGISSCGKFLIMPQTTPIRQEELPEDLPAWMTDVKKENFGWFNGKIVLHDYGLLNLEDWITNRKPHEENFNAVQAPTKINESKADILGTTSPGV